MFASFFTSTLVAWLTRRAAELGGLLLAAEQVAPGTTQELLRTSGMLLTGQWENVSLGAVFGLVSVIGGLIWNVRSTFGGHTTVDGQRVPNKKLPAQKKVMVEEVARTAKPRTIFEALGGLFGR
jgi:hypothetical protein